MPAFRPAVRGGSLALAASVGLAIAACSDGGTQVPSEPRRPNASRLADAATFAHRPAKGAPREISKQKAWRLAEIWIRDFGPRLEETWEQERGAEIDWSQLERCGPTPYVASPFQAPPSHVPLPVRRGVGPWWLVNFCATGEPQINVAVSAWNTDLEIIGGELRFPSRAGNHFVPEPIPPTTEYPDTRLLSPARAKQMAREVTGMRPAGRPELVAQPFVKPQFAHWRIRLPSPARLKLRNGNGTVERSQVFVGSHRPKAPGVVAVADRSSPSSMELGYYENVNARRRIPVEARPGYPLTKKAVAGPAESMHTGGATP